MNRLRNQGRGRGGHSSGVTLIDILIILAILGTLAAIIIPNLIQWLGW